MSQFASKPLPDVAARIQRNVATKFESAIGKKGKEVPYERRAFEKTTTTRREDPRRTHPLVRKLATLLNTYKFNRRHYGYCQSYVRETQRLLDLVRGALLEHRGDLLKTSCGHEDREKARLFVRRNPETVKQIQRLIKDLDNVIYNDQKRSVSLAESNILLIQYYAIVDALPKKNEYCYETGATTPTPDNQRAFAELVTWPADLRIPL